MIKKQINQLKVVDINSSMSKVFEVLFIDEFETVFVIDERQYLYDIITYRDFIKNIGITDNLADMLNKDCIKIKMEDEEEANIIFKKNSVVRKIPVVDDTGRLLFAYERASSIADVVSRDKFDKACVSRFMEQFGIDNVCFLTEGIYSGNKTQILEILNKYFEIDKVYDQPLEYMNDKVSNSKRTILIHLSNDDMKHVEHRKSITMPILHIVELILSYLDVVDIINRLAKIINKVVIFTVPRIYGCYDYADTDIVYIKENASKIISDGLYLGEQEEAYYSEVMAVPAIIKINNEL